jgi:hypothetical protein
VGLALTINEENELLVLRDCGNFHSEVHWFEQELIETAFIRVALVHSKVVCKITIQSEGPLTVDIIRVANLFNRERLMVSGHRFPGKQVNYKIWQNF